MREKIIQESIKSLRSEGLKFSVDVLADRLKISKKTIYKFFPDKQSLALALYKEYFAGLSAQAESLLDNRQANVYSDLLRLYFDSKIMTRSEIFNKYKLNETTYSYVTELSNSLWATVSTVFSDKYKEQDMKVLRVIIDGTFEKLCSSDINPDIVIERLVKML